MTPDVSVVIISFDDVARLPRAIASVQRQTLRSLEIIVVDDASTDDTEQVVRAIAAQDPRIRYERLPENSGGCSAPRNRGVELARAAWVMFCDSDDEYERHACKNLLEAAERTGADVVCGTAERVDVRTGRVRRWRPEVHAQARVADGLADLPDILNDTISVNKIYRTDLLRRNGIRFPEGLLFEDQLFTLEAMAAADRIATIPEVVYRWYVDRLSDEPSITQRRNEARNVESRIEINRRIDTFLTMRALPDVQAVKDEKFLRHDVYLYLSSMLEVDDETATELMTRLAPYVESVNLRPAWRLRTGLRVAIYHLLARDLEGVRSAMRFVKWASVVDLPVVARDGREYWASAQLADGPTIDGHGPRAWLDVTDLHLLSIPFTQRRFLHRLEAVAVAGSRITVTGSTVDYDGSLAEATEVEPPIPRRWGSHGPRRSRGVDRLGRNPSHVACGWSPGRPAAAAARGEGPRHRRRCRHARRADQRHECTIARGGGGAHGGALPWSRALDGGGCACGHPARQRCRRLACGSNRSVAHPLDVVAWLVVPAPRNDATGDRHRTVPARRRGPGGRVDREPAATAPARGARDGRGKVVRRQRASHR